MINLLRDGALAIKDGMTDNTRSFFDGMQASWKSREPDREKFRDNMENWLYNQILLFYLIT